MLICKGDYVSCIWACDSPIAKWSIWTIKRADSLTWELAMTWDEKDLFDEAVCRTLHHRVNLPNEPEHLIQAKVDALVYSLEESKSSTRLALIEVKSCDPATITGEIYESALHNENIGFFICIYDGPMAEKQ